MLSQWVVSFLKISQPLREMISVRGASGLHWPDRFKEMVSFALRDEYVVEPLGRVLLVPLWLFGY
jgi:hypothetical protein